MVSFGGDIMCVGVVADRTLTPALANPHAYLRCDRLHE